jgi:uncharacterized membrane protein HdeD (DUF308 family)
MQESNKVTSGRLVTGAVFIVLGIFLLLVRFTELPIGHGLWPFFLIVGGLLFYLGYFWSHNRRPGAVGMLFPGTYLLIIGLLFLAISFAVMYFFTPAGDKDKKDLRSTALIMLVISAGLFVIAAKAGIFWPIALVVIGLFIIFKSFNR